MYSQVMPKKVKRKNKQKSSFESIKSKIIKNVIYNERNFE